MDISHHLYLSTSHNRQLPLKLLPYFSNIYKTFSSIWLSIDILLFISKTQVQKISFCLSLIFPHFPIDYSSTFHIPTDLIFSSRLSFNWCPSFVSINQKVKSRILSSSQVIPILFKYLQTSSSYWIWLSIGVLPSNMK